MTAVKNLLLSVDVITAEFAARYFVRSVATKKYLEKLSVVPVMWRLFSKHFARLYSFSIY